MLPKWHILFGFIFTLLIYLIIPINPIQAIFMFISSFLVDTDHYLLYVWKKKDIHLTRAYNWFKIKREIFIKFPIRERSKYKKPIYIFHGIEFWALILFFSFFVNWFWFIFIGIVLHMILDLIEMLYLKEPLSSKLSIIYTYTSNKGKKSFF